jgi:hypothetical protein
MRSNGGGSLEIFRGWRIIAQIMRQNSKGWKNTPAALFIEEFKNTGTSLCQGNIIVGAETMTAKGRVLASSREMFLFSYCLVHDWTGWPNERCTTI